MKKKNFEGLEKRYIISKGIKNIFENKSRWNDFNEILIINYEWCFKI